MQAWVGVGLVLLGELLHKLLGVRFVFVDLPQEFPTLLRGFWDHNWIIRDDLEGSFFIAPRDVVPLVVLMVMILEIVGVLVLFVP
jgi:hypothetical protein